MCKSHDAALSTSPVLQLVIQVQPATSLHSFLIDIIAHCETLCSETHVSIMSEILLSQKRLVCVMMDAQSVKSTGNVFHTYRLDEREDSESSAFMSSAGLAT